MSARPPTAAEPDASLGDLAAAGAFVIGLIAAWLYLAGWTYAYHYFDRFGVPLRLADLPKEHYFVYGAAVARGRLGWVFGFVAAGLGLGIFWRRLPVARRRQRLLLAAVIVLGLFWLGQTAGISAAHARYAEQRAADYGAYPRLQVWLKGESAQGGDPRPDLASGCYRLLLHNQDRLLLFRPFKGAPAAELPVVILPWADVMEVRILPDYTSCR